MIAPPRSRWRSAVPEAIPARVTGTEPVSECEAGVPANPTPMPTQRVAERRPSSTRCPSSHSRSIATNPSEAEDVADEQREAGAVRLDQLRRARRDQHHADRRREDRGTRLERRVAEHVLQELLADEHGAHQRPEDDDARRRRRPRRRGARRRRRSYSGFGARRCAQQERDRARDRDRRQAEGQRALVRHGREVDREDERGDEHDGQDAAEVVDGIGRLVDVARHEQRSPGPARRAASGSVIEEHRAPPEMLEQDAREQRPERGDRAADARPQRDRLRPPRPGPQRGDQRERRRDTPSRPRGRRARARRRAPRRRAPRRRAGTPGSTAPCPRTSIILRPYRSPSAPR